MLKANSAFHLALRQQGTTDYNEETLEVQRRHRANIGPDRMAGPEDRETVFDIGDFQTDEQMKSFFEVGLKF